MQVLQSSVSEKTLQAITGIAGENEQIRTIMSAKLNQFRLLWTYRTEKKIPNAHNMLRVRQVLKFERFIFI